MDSRVPEAAYRPAYPPIPTHSPLSPPPPTVPLPWSLPSFSTTTDVPVMDNHLVSVPPPPPYSSSYAGDESASKACAACRFRRQSCKADCLLAPFFPATDENRFQKALRLFGVRRMQKTVDPLLPDQRAVAMATMIYESEVRVARPATGCLDIILQLHSQIERKSAHLAYLRQHHSVPPPLPPTLDTVIAGDGKIIPSTLQSDDTNSIATGNLKRRFQDFSEEQGEEMMREPRRRRTSQWHS